MRNYFRLFRVLLKNTASAFSDGKAQSRKLTWLLMALLLMGAMSLVFVLYFIFHEGFLMIAPLQQEGILFLSGFQFTCLLIFLFSLFLIPAVYYFSQDISILLALPLPPQTIIAAKFSVCLLYEYIFTAMVCLPLFAAYAQVFGFTLSLLCAAVFTILTLPLYPLILTSLLTMFVMRFSPFMKSRDRFNIIGSLLLIIGALAFSMWTAQWEGQEETAILSLLMEGNNSLLNTISYLFLGLPFLAKGIMQSNLLALGIYLLINLAAIILFYFFARALYFKGVIGIEESSSSHKKLTNKGLAKHTKKHHIFLTYVKKEFRILLRTPAFLTNCMISAAVPPCMILALFFTSDVTQLTKMLPEEMMQYFLQQPSFPFYMLIGGLMCGFVCANFNLISATAISREGSHFTFMKYIPVTLQTQINAKVFCGACVSILSVLLSVIPILLLFHIPIFYIFIITGASIISIILGNYLAILLDLLHPKLVWEQEAIAVKQNLSGIISLLGGVTIALGIGFLTFHIPEKYMMLFAIGLLLLCILLCFLSIRYVNKLVEKVFYKLF